MGMYGTARQLTDPVGSARDEVRSEDHLIFIYDRSEQEPVENRMAVLEEGSLIRSQAVQLLPGGGIDIVDDLPELPLVEGLKDGLFRKDHTEHGMGLFDSPLLAGTHRVAVVDGGTQKAVPVGLKGLRIPEFSAPVRKDGVEQGDKVKVTKVFLKMVKDSPDRALRTPLEKEGKEELRVREAEGKDTFGRSNRRQDGIHLNELGGRKAECPEILISTPDKHRTVRNGLLFEGRLSGLELHLALQVDVPCSEDALVDIVVQGLHGHLELRMAAEDVVRGLAVPDQGLNDGVDPVDL